MAFISASDPDYIPPSIDHDNPEVIETAAILMNADPDCQGWEYNYVGATQGSHYYEEPYRHEIRRYITMAEAVINSKGDK